MTTKTRTRKITVNHQFILSEDKTYYSFQTSNGYTFKIDAEDYPYVSKNNWFCKNQSGLYLMRKCNRFDTGHYTSYKYISLAGDLLGRYSVPRAEWEEKSLIVKYLNDDSTDIRKANLALITKQELAAIMVSRMDYVAAHKTRIDNMQDKRDEEAHKKRQREVLDQRVKDYKAPKPNVRWEKLTAEDLENDASYAYVSAYAVNRSYYED